jgi:hypothetical protein
MSELRITDTNSANDSRGRAFGLEGNDFIYVLVAFVVSLALYLVFAFALRVGMAAALVFSLPVFLGVAAWVLFFRHNRPDGYAEDWFDDLVNGEGWSLASGTQPVRLGKEPHA